MYLEQKRTNEALDIFRQALLSTKKKSEYYFNIAIVHINMSNLELAVPSLEMAISEDKTYPFPYSNLVAIYAMRREYTQAEKLIQQAINLKIKDADLYMNAAAFYKDIGNKIKSKEMYEKYIEISTL